MRNYILLFIITLSIFSCKSRIYKDIAEISKHSKHSYIIYGNENDSLLKMISTETKQEFEEVFKQKYFFKYVIAHDKSVTDLNSDRSLKPRKKIAFNLYIDQHISKYKEPYLDSYFRRLDTIMKNMYLDFSFDFNYQNVKDSINFDSLKTGGKVNANNIKEFLKNSYAYNDEIPIQIYLFHTADFFNNASALCVPASKENMVMGDTMLFENPVLFLHEIFHALGLRHAERYGCNSMPSNIMDTRTIGCSHTITARQIIMMSQQKYIPPIDNDISFPECNTCNGYADYNTMAEIYLNSSDIQIDEVPLKGDHMELLVKYSVELNTKKMNNTNKVIIQENYKNQAIALGLSNPDDYAKEIILSHESLRQRNLLRWLNANHNSQSEIKSDINNLIKSDSIRDNIYSFYIEKNFGYTDSKKMLFNFCESEIYTPCILPTRDGPIGASETIHNHNNQSHNHRH